MTGSLLLLMAAGQAFAAIPDDDIQFPPAYQTMHPPAVGAAYKDPVFETSITRITDALAADDDAAGGKLTWIANEYSTASPFNNDNSRLILVHQSYFGLYDGDGKFLGKLPFEINSSSEPRWSRKDNRTLYYHSGNQLKSYNVSTGDTDVVHTFSEYASISGKGETDISIDGDHFVFVGDDRYVFVYTISTDRKLTAFDAGGHGFDSVYITPNNNVTITWLKVGIETRYTGIELFDSNMKFQRQVAHSGGHMHMARDLDGDEVLIWTNSNDPRPVSGQNAIVKIRLADGKQTCLLSLDWSLAVHITASDDTWAFVETYNPKDLIPPGGWFPYTDELLQIKLDGSEIRRLAHHRSRPLNGYNYQPKLTVSRDGTRLVYASNFGLQSTMGFPKDYSDVYMIVTAPHEPVATGSDVVDSPTPVDSSDEEAATNIEAKTESHSRNAVSMDAVAFNAGWAKACSRYLRDRNRIGGKTSVQPDKFDKSGDALTRTQGVIADYLFSILTDPNIDNGYEKAMSVLAIKPESVYEFTSAYLVMYPEDLPVLEKISTSSFSRQSDAIGKKLQPFFNATRNSAMTIKDERVKKDDLLSKISGFFSNAVGKVSSFFSGLFRNRKNPAPTNMGTPRAAGSAEVSQNFTTRAPAGTGTVFNALESGDSLQAKAKLDQAYRKCVQLLTLLPPDDPACVEAMSEYQRIYKEYQTMIQDE